jgi:glycopeptide antibiotics resistance protein
MKTLFWLYFSGIILLITLPINQSGSLNSITVVHLRGDYFFHILTFLPWAFFGVAMKRNLWSWLFFGLLFATGTELLQIILPWRRFNINDLIANGFGVFAGALLHTIFQSIQTSCKKQY